MAEIFCSAALLALAGCGGGGGSSATGAAPVADAPSASPSGTVAAAPAASPPAPESESPAPTSPQMTQSGVDPALTQTLVAAPAQAPAPAPAPALQFVSAPAPSFAAATAPAPAPAPSAPAPFLADCEMFPSNAIFNTRIDDTSRFPKHPQSDSWVAIAGGSIPMTANWSSASNPNDTTNYYGMPINYVDGTSATTSWPTVSFDYLASGVSSERSYPQKSDCAVDNGGSFGIVRDCTTMSANQRRFPFPSSNVLVEGGNCGGPNSCGDHHVLVVERGACRLWESHFAHNISGQWYAVSTAAWDLRSLSMRPYDWASADAAGMPITPLLAKASEASSGEIRHALRVTFGVIAHAVQWPARFGDSGAGNPAAMPFGALLRLRADFPIPDSWSPQTKAVALAAKRYGMYVADNGADFHVQGEPSSAWDGRAWNELHGIKMSDMEFVDLRSVTTDPRFSPDSMAAGW